MPRKKITEKQKQEVIEEAKKILTDIIVRWFGFVDTRMGIHNMPSFRIKLGGWTGWYSKELDLVALNYYSWRKMLLAQKRLLLIHEYLHKLGIKHSASKSFLGGNDLLSLKAYERIFGRDKAWIEFEVEIDSILDDLGLKQNF